MKQKEQRGRFLVMLLGMLGASLLRNIWRCREYKIFFQEIVEVI